MIVGWLEDPAERVRYTGGAELDSQALRAESPYDIAVMPPGRVESGCDGYIVANCIYYHPRDIRNVTGPMVKLVNDAWRHGHPSTRTAVLERADLTVFRSPLHRERFGFDVTSETCLIPSVVDLDRYRAADGTVERKERAVWVAHVMSMERAAGALAARAWADERQLDLDAYGVGTPNGPVDHDDMPELLASYRWYVHLMGRGDYEPFGRVTVEAWAAGCNLAVGADTGATYWLREDPDALEAAPRMFWEAFDRTVERCGNLISA
jgi:hypothetical protein